MASQKQRIDPAPYIDQRTGRKTWGYKVAQYGGEKPSAYLQAFNESKSSSGWSGGSRTLARLLEQIGLLPKGFSEKKMRDAEDAQVQAALAELDRRGFGALAPVGLASASERSKLKAKVIMPGSGTTAASRAAARAAGDLTLGYKDPGSAAMAKQVEEARLAGTKVKARVDPEQVAALVRAGDITQAEADTLLGSQPRNSTLANVDPGQEQQQQPTDPYSTDPNDYRRDSSGRITRLDGSHVTEAEGMELFQNGLNADHIPMIGADGGEESGGDSSLPSTGVPALDAILARFDKWLADSAAQGQQVNPDLEITPQLAEQFLDQASKEFEPYYRSQFSAIKEDVSRSLGTLHKQYQLMRDTEDAELKKSLAVNRESHAEKGTIFSGGRNRQEGELTAESQRDLDAAGLEYGRIAGGIARTAEREIGSRNLGQLDIPTFRGYQASNQGRGGIASTSRSLDFFDPGNITGSLERERDTAIQLRKNELEEAERRRRSLNFYNT